MYYYIASFRGEDIAILRQSDESEYQRITELSKPISSILTNAKRIEPLQKTFKKISAVNIALMKKNPDYDISDLNDTISEYLFRLRKFFDNWETYLKRTFGADSSNYKEFKKATNNEYDSHIEYQIVYHLRNADQHCDNIVSNIIIGNADDGATYIKAISKCSYLLSIFDRWKKDEKTYLATHESIDIFSFISTMQKCINRIHQKTMDTLFSESLYNNCAKLLEYANEFPDTREHLFFLKQDRELNEEFYSKSRFTFNRTNWMVKQCIGLLQLFLRNNTDVAIVAYHGNLPYSCSDDYSINLDAQEKTVDLNIGELIKVNDKQYRCYNKRIDLVNDAYTAIVINTALGGKEEAIICKQWNQYIEALIWKTSIF